MSSSVANMDAALEELERLGVRAEGYMRDDEGKPGALVFGSGKHAGWERTFTTEPETLSTRDGALEWAQIVASLAHGVEA